MKYIATFSTYLDEKGNEMEEALIFELGFSSMEELEIYEKNNFLGDPLEVVKVDEKENWENLIK